MKYYELIIIDYSFFRLTSAYNIFFFSHMYFFVSFPSFVFFLFFFQSEDTILYIGLTYFYSFFFFFQAEDGIRDIGVTGVQTCALPISSERLRGFTPTTSLIWCWPGPWSSSPERRSC